MVTALLAFVLVFSSSDKKYRKDDGAHSRLIVCLLTTKTIFYLVQPSLANYRFNSFYSFVWVFRVLAYFSFLFFRIISFSAHFWLCVMVVVFTWWVKIVLFGFFFWKIFAGTFFQFECLRCLQLVLNFLIWNFLFFSFRDKERKRDRQTKNSITNYGNGWPLVPECSGLCIFFFKFFKISK